MRRAPDGQAFSPANITRARTQGKAPTSLDGQYRPREAASLAQGLAVDHADFAAAEPKLGSKAETLARLQGRLASARVLPQVTFTVAEWRRDAAGVIAKIQSTVPDVALVVRSSAQAEDTFEHSNAGAFESRLGVTNAPTALRIAVEAVIASYSAGADDA